MIRTCGKPFIARINGVVAGGGNVMLVESGICLKSSLSAENAGNPWERTNDPEIPERHGLFQRG